MLIHIIDAPAEESASARRRRERGKICLNIPLYM